MDHASRADAFAFIGNSLLRPMSQTETVGLDPAFWEAFPDFGDQDVRTALDACAAFASGAQVRAAAGEDMVQQVSVEHTRLFVGPPSPAAPPWETMGREAAATVGFGEPTVAMQSVLRGVGLEVSNENNQYADHMGIELLVLSEMLRRVQTGVLDAEKAAAFTREHPAAWMEAFHVKVHEAAPGGYFDHLLAVAETLLRTMAP